MSPKSIASASSEWNEEPLGWNIDLQRIVQAEVTAVCSDEPVELMVYTWLLGNGNQVLCTEPRIAWIGNDAREWEDEILHPWRHHIRSSDVVRLDCVMPTPPKSDVEEHTAHILVTLNPTHLEPILVSLEFQGIGDDEALVRFALLTPKSIAKQDRIHRLPLLRQIEDRRVDWTGAGFDEGREQIMRVRNGRCVRISTPPELMSVEDPQRIV